MRKIVLAGLCSFLAIGYGELTAQNKTLGVGTTIPNTNAALHIESPTSNQGFIMPRLNTQQRTAMSALLTEADKGLMLFDMDQSTIYIWNGLAWQSTAEVAGGPKLIYPYKDSVVTPTGTNDLFALKYNNDEPKRVMRIENHGLNNGSSALSVFNAGPGLGAYFQVSNPATTSSTIYATTNSDAVTQIAPVAVYGESTGTGSLGGSFRITNPANGHPALYAETMGTGPAFVAEKLDPQSTGDVIIGEHVGAAGSAGNFVIDNIANTAPAVSARTNGSGSAIRAENSGAADGFAGNFENLDPANNFPAIQASTAGQGPGVRVIQSTGPGLGMDVIMQNQTSTAPGFAVTHNGLGTSGEFIVNNAQNASPAVVARTGGAGPALRLDNWSGGLAIEMVNGGLKYSVADISAPGQITAIAGVYRISLTAPSECSLPTNVPDGTFCKVFASATDVTIGPVMVLRTQSSVTVSAGTIRDFLFLGGVWYENP